MPLMQRQRVGQAMVMRQLFGEILRQLLTLLGAELSGQRKFDLSIDSTIFGLKLVRRSPKLLGVFCPCGQMS